MLECWNDELFAVRVNPAPVLSSQERAWRQRQEMKRHGCARVAVRKYKKDSLLFGEGRGYGEGGDQVSPSSPCS